MIAYKQTAQLDHLTNPHNQKLSSGGGIALNALEERLKQQIKTCLEMKEEKDPLLMTINSHELFTCNSINLIFGDTGTGKSSFAHSVVTTLLRNDRIDDNLKLRNESDKEIRVLWIDSELYPNEFAKAKNKILINSMRDKNENRLMPIRMQHFATAARFEAIEILLQMYGREYPGDHFVILIDTITDLVTDFNDVAEADHLTKRLLLLVNIHNCTIICVMHETKHLSKATGHLGSFLARKCSSIVRISKTKKGTIRIENSKNRNQREFEPIFAEFVEGSSSLRIADSSLNLVPVQPKVIGRGRTFTQDEFHAAYMKLSENGEVPYDMFKNHLAEVFNCTEKTILNHIKRNDGRVKYVKEGKIGRSVIVVYPNC